MADTANTAEYDALKERVDRAAKVDAASSRAVELVKHYSEIDPRDGDENNPWQNPEKIFKELRQARQDVVDAWGTCAERRDGGIPHHSSGGSDDSFRSIYIGMVTDAFAEELETMRKESNKEIDVDILVECLQSGMELFDKDERELLKEEHDEKTTRTGPKDITPHELRRRQLGFHF